MKRLSPLLALLCLSCSRGIPAQKEFVLGTICSVNLYEEGTRGEYDAIFAELRRLQAMMAFGPASAGEEASQASQASQTSQTSQTSQASQTSQTSQASQASQTGALDLINENSGIGPVRAPEELLDVLERARYYAELSGGAFDPTVGPLVRLWGIGGSKPRVPGADEIQEALALVDWRDLLIDREAGTAFLRRRGQALDLGAIARG
jgi:thiamine biosynthesis lipoprotein